MLASGTLIDGRYRVEGLLGQGGQGAVYEVADTRTGAQLALKHLVATDAAEGERLLQEGRLLAALRHPALPIVRDTFAAAEGCFLVTDLVHGDDLEALLARRGPLPAAQVLAWAERLLDALAYLHSRQPPVVHRDIKPQNLRLRPDGQLMLLDFGFAARDQLPGGYTPRYAAPEQLRGGAVDARGDLYALAATLYHLAGGEPPPGALDRLTATIAGRADPLPPASPRLPGGLAAALWAALALDPEQRPRDAIAMAGLLHGASTAIEPEGAAPPPPRHVQLPAPPTPLVGRGAEVTAVVELLSREGVRLVTLYGPGGIGKTRLAIAVGEALARRGDGPDGIHFISLATLSDAALVLPAVAQALGVRERPGQPLRDTLADYLRERRRLLLIDNLEQVIAAAADLAELLARAPLLRMLVTSREVLNVTAEHSVAVPLLAYPDPARGLAPEALLEHEAIALFVERARAVRPSFGLTQENAAAVAAICARLDGLPLAIELAAARVRALQPAALLSRLERQLELLTGGARDLPERQQTLRATVAWSYDLLDEAEQALFAQLAAFAGTCTLEAAEAVCDEGAGLPVIEGLPALAEKSLLQIDRQRDDEARFRLLLALREFAQERLQARPEAETLYRRHLTFFTALVEHAGEHLYGTDQLQWLEQIGRDYDNLRLGMERACAGPMIAEGVDLGCALVPFWDTRGYLSEGRAWLQRLLDAGGDTPDARGASLLSAAGQLALAQGDQQSARRLLEASVARWRGLGAPGGLAPTLTQLALVRREAGAFEEARALLDEAITHLRLEPAGPRLANALVALAHTHVEQGDYEAARAPLDESIALWRGLGAWSGLAIALNISGIAARDTGDLPAAAELFGESLAIARAIGDRMSIVVGLNNLGTVALYRGDYEAAERHLNEGRGLARELGNARSAAIFLANLSLAAVELGQYERAAALSLENLEWQRAEGDRTNSLVSLNNLGRAAMFQGDYDAAERWYQEALELARELGTDVAGAYLEHNLGDIAWCRGDPGGAAGRYRASLSLFRGMGDPRGAAYCLEGLAACAEPHCAARLFGAAEALRERVGTPLTPADRTLYERKLAPLRPWLASGEGAAAWADGRALEPRAAIAEALAGGPAAAAS